MITLKDVQWIISRKPSGIKYFSGILRDYTWKPYVVRSSPVKYESTYVVDIDRINMNYNTSPSAQVAELKRGKTAKFRGSSKASGTNPLVKMSWWLN